MRTDRLKTRGRRAGYSLLEVIVAVGVSTVIAGGTFTMLDRSAAAAQGGVRSAYIGTTLQRILNRVTTDLRDSGTDSSGEEHVGSHPANASTTASTLSFEKRVAFDGLATDWGSTITYRLDASGDEVMGNGADDDHDGVVDEALLVRVQDGEVVSIADDVTEFTVTRDAGSYLMGLTVIVSRRVENDVDPVERKRVIVLGLQNTP